MSDFFDFLRVDLYNMTAEMATECNHQGKRFYASRSTYRRENSLGDGGFMNTASMVLTTAYDNVTQGISLGDVITIGNKKFRVMSAELSQDAVSVDIVLEDINK